MQNNTTPKNDFLYACAHVSGKDTLGEPKAALSYMFYDMTKSDGTGRVVRTLQNAEVLLDPLRSYDGLISLDIIFESSESPELALFWGYLQEFKRRSALEPASSWVFFISLLEKASLKFDPNTPDVLYTVNIINPILHTLARTSPTDFISNETEFENVTVGGNIVKLLIPSECVTFDLVSDIDTAAIYNDAYIDEQSRIYQDSFDDNEG